MMAIENSVGLNGTNEKADAKVIQAALNLIEHKDFNIKKMTVDGIIGNITIANIKEFQEKVLGLSSPDGLIQPCSIAEETLRSLIPKGDNSDEAIKLDALKAIMADGTAKNCETYHPLLNKEMSKYGVTSPLRIAHFLAQIGHESASFTYTQEIENGDIYEGRSKLGNIEKGDGVRFKGRGLLQLTGRSNYKGYSKEINIDLLSSPNETIVATNSKYALGSALWYWKNKGLNQDADKDDILIVTKVVNGGFNHLDDRIKYLNRSRFFLVDE